MSTSLQNDDLAESHKFEASQVDLHLPALQQSLFWQRGQQTYLHPNFDILSRNFERK